jgi:hypothetical protein
MSLGVVCKSSEGIVLAADSRVTLTFPQMSQVGLPTMPPMPITLIHASYDNATKLLKIKGQDYVGVVTYGLGTIGLTVPRTAHSFLPEFEDELRRSGGQRLPVADFAQKLGDFFMCQWTSNMHDYVGPDQLIFLVGGFDEDAPYGRIFEVDIPSRPQPIEHYADINNFGIVWGGQLDFPQRLINGFDYRALDIITNTLNLNPSQRGQIEVALRQLSVPIPYQILPIQDCVDLSIMLIRTTISLQSFYTGLRGVGGMIEVAIITREDGFKPIQRKKIKGEPFVFEEE